MANTAWGTDAESAANLAWVASVEHRRGNGRIALALYKRAYEKEPEFTYENTIAILEAEMGLHVEAAQQYEDLARKFPTEPAWRKAADAERAAALKTPAYP
jgi:hypothetical protein